MSVNGNSSHQPNQPFQWHMVTFPPRHPLPIKPPLPSQLRWHIVSFPEPPLPSNQRKRKYSPIQQPQQQHTFPPTLPLLLHGRAVKLIAHTKFEQAEQAAKEALDVERKLLYPRAHVLAVLNDNLIFALNKQRKFAQAQQAAQRALDVERNSLYPRLHRLAQLNGHLASALNKQGKFRQAQQAARDGIVAERSLMFYRFYVLAELNQQLACALKNQGKLGRAKQAARDGIIAERKSQFPRPHILTELTKLLSEAKWHSVNPSMPSPRPKTIS